tara:strand:- start:26720 stop:26923 length:204 start_codon:yes stop_codon:yes gene_type:complete
MEGVYEHFFYMKYSGNWSLAELYGLPIGLRNWFIERTVKQKEKEAEAQQQSQPSRSPPQNPHSNRKP